MRELLRPYRAALKQGGRRSVLFLLVLAAGIFGAVSWSSYRPLERERAFLRLLESSRPLTQEAFGTFAGGFTCTPAGEFGPGGKQSSIGQQPGPTDSPSIPTETPPSPVSNPGVCQLITNDGRVIGPEFPIDFLEGFELDPEVLESIRPELRVEQRRVVDRAERSFAIRRILDSRIRAGSTLLGIVFAVLLGGSLMGAEWRWGVWPTLLAHEPRRGRVFGTKLAALWTLVGLGFLLTIGVGTGVDAVMRSINEIDSAGGPSYPHLAEVAGWGLLGLELFATMAASLSSIVRTSIAGVVSLALALGDWLLVQKYHWLRHFLPVQQITALAGTPIPEGRVSSGVAWFPAVSSATECTSTPNGFVVECHDVFLKPPPHWRASLVLAAWIVGFAMLGWASLRARDVPQS